jgi:hypothetical protein
LKGVFIAKGTLKSSHLSFLFVDKKNVKKHISSKIKILNLEKNKKIIFLRASRLITQVSLPSIIAYASVRLKKEKKKVILA